jgi:predicted glycogen debranching enzyme
LFPITMRAAATAPTPPIDIVAALQREWLLTNGLGGFAMGTLAGVNSRRYHGLLIAATHPPVGRVLALHSIVEQLVVDDSQVELASQAFGESCELHPDGCRRLVQSQAERGQAWRWRYATAAVEASRTVEMMPGRNVARIEYAIAAVNPRTALELRGRVLTPLRDFHGLTRQSGPTPSIEHVDDRELVVRSDRVRLVLRADGGAWRVDPQWWYNFTYQCDRDRGQDCNEDVWSPGLIALRSAGRLRLRVEAEVVVVDAAPITISIARTSAADRSSESSDLARSRLVHAASQFIVKRRAGETWQTSVIAGYPWFGDWGRDTMISLPGLMLCTGRIDEARDTLSTFARAMRNGLIPNLFDDYGGAAHYNTVDASLWFVHAVGELHQRQPDNLTEFVDACRAIIAAYRRGTDFGIHMDADGLIAAGDPSTQLTWMDAKRDGVAFTPRYGKPVEISALWHHALLTLAELSNDAREADDLRRLADRVAASFRAKFWCPERQCLHDVLLPRDGGWHADGKLRPNQIFAVSLPHSPLQPDQQRSVVQVVKERLLTPVGLRTLDPAAPDYRGRYEGNLFQRDAAYHQGTVWPWLIGPYCEALARIDGFSAASRANVRNTLQPLIAELDRCCIGQLPEVYDGDEPRRPQGCPAQAWSVAEVLRTWDFSAEG